MGVLSELPRPRSSRVSVRRTAGVGPCEVSYGVDMDAYAPARSVVAALGVSVPAPAGLGLGDKARVGVEVAPKKMAWMNTKHGRIFAKEDGTVGVRTRPVAIRDLAKISLGATVKDGKAKLAAPDVSATDLKLKLLGAGALITLGKSLPAAASLKLPGTPARVGISASAGVPSPLPGKGGWAFDLQSLNVNVKL